MDVDLDTKQQFVPAGTPSGSTTEALECNNGALVDSLLSFSCRTRAECFARKLHIKLKNLGVSVTGDSSQEGEESYQNLLMKPSSNNNNSHNKSVTGGNKQYYPEVTRQKDYNLTDHHHHHQNLLYSNNKSSSLAFDLSNKDSKAKAPDYEDVASGSACDGGTMVVKAESPSSSDSDFYFDFDIGSPGSPTEENGGPSFPVVNPCDDLFCKDCSLTSCPNNGGPLDSCHTNNGQQNVGENGIESGCVVSSPASTSPDDEDGLLASTDPPIHDHHHLNNGRRNKSADEATTKSSAGLSLPQQEEDYFRIGSFDITDGSSDASTDSIYYDVENLSSPSICSSSPKTAEELLLTCEEEVTSPATTATVDDVVVDSNLAIVDPPHHHHNIEESKTEPEPVSIFIRDASIEQLDEIKNTAPVGAAEGEEGTERSSTELTTLKVDVGSSAASNTKHANYTTQLLSPIISSDEEEITTRPRIQRSSSLKTGKTPPGTPGRKKIVRFADVLGLDLADVRTFLDEIPNVPKSAYKDLTDAMESAGVSFPNNFNSSNRKLNKTLLPSFHQPVSMPEFFDKIRDQKVLLENAFLVDNFTVKGTVRVMNMDFHKSVYIRYTYNDWATITDFQTTYVPGSCDGFSDKFEFTIPLLPEAVEIGGRVSFACRFHCQGQQFWDNNAGRNYVFHCVPSSSQSQQNHLDFHLNSHGGEDPWVNRMWM